MKVHVTYLRQDGGKMDTIDYEYDMEEACKEAMSSVSALMSRSAIVHSNGLVHRVFTLDVVDALTYKGPLNAQERMGGW